MKHTLTIDIDESAVVRALTAAVKGMDADDALHLLDRIDATEEATPGSLFRLMAEDAGKDKRLRVEPGVAMKKLIGE